MSNPTKKEKLKILFASANPNKDLSLDEEYKAIEEGINGTEYREYIEIKVKLACEYDNLIDAINSEKADIVHFSGHGEGDEGLKFYNPDLEGHEELIDDELIGGLFETEDSNLKLVILNSCYSIVQAKEVVKHIDYVIGMNNEIGDETAISLATRFYKSFASDKSIKDSFKQALNQVKRKSPKEKDIPQLLTKDEKVKDIKISDIVDKNANSKGGGDTNSVYAETIYGVGIQTGGTVTQTINNDGEK